MTKIQVTGGVAEGFRAFFSEESAEFLPNIARYLNRNNIFMGKSAYSPTPVLTKQKKKPRFAPALYSMLYDDRSQLSDA